MKLRKRGYSGWWDFEGKDQNKNTQRRQTSQQVYQWKHQGTYYSDLKKKSEGSYLYN